MTTLFELLKAFASWRSVERFAVLAAITWAVDSGAVTVALACTTLA